jgi:MATE family multidrug resistance protein
MVRRSFKAFWEGPGGGRDVLQIGYPLILGNLSFTIQTFVNRLFLTWFAPEALAGAMTGLFVAISLIGLFSVTGEYLTTFIAQYLGAGRPQRVGPVIWQGIYFSAAAGLFVALLSPLSGVIFRWAGHAPPVMGYEIAYTRLLMLGSFPLILMQTLATFFAGRGETRVVLLVTLGVTAVNVVLDYLWIFGRLGFPRGGVTGAALATITSESLGSIAFFGLVLRKASRDVYKTLSGWRFEPELFVRILRFGIPSGLQFSIELLAFACFMILVGRIGTVPLAASGAAFNLNIFVFIPMVGLGVGVSALVGRYLGGGRPDLAERSAWSALWMSLAYMSFCSALYLFAPGLLLAPFAAGGDPRAFVPAGAIATVLLRFVALYSIFDMMNVIFASALKGAGDTRYPLIVTFLLAFLAMLGPAYLLCVVWKAGVYVAWMTATAYVVCLGILMLSRFSAGRWKSLRIVEPHPKDLDVLQDPSSAVESIRSS